MSETVGDARASYKNHKKNVTFGGFGRDSVFPKTPHLQGNERTIMMETVTQNCGLYLAHKLARYYQAHEPRWRRLFPVSKRERTVRAPKDLRRFQLQRR